MSSTIIGECTMITSIELKKLEREAHAHGVLVEHLMENAASAVVQILEEKFDLRHHKIIIFCGKGNNGADGFCIAHRLLQYSPLVILVGDKNTLTEESAAYYAMIKKEVPIIQIQAQSDLEKISLQKHLHYIFIDALLGMGVHGDVREPLTSVISFYNSYGATRVSIDIPSGLDPDTGKALGVVCESDLVITYHDLKPGLASLNSKVVVIDIGLPQRAHLKK